VGYCSRGTVYYHPQNHHGALTVVVLHDITTAILLGWIYIFIHTTVPRTVVLYPESVGDSIHLVSYHITSCEPSSPYVKNIQDPTGFPPIDTRPKLHRFVPA
jgi:hypothetical protein